MVDDRKTLFVHIGSHKTGTTALQKTFFDNRDLLERHGVSYLTPPNQDQIHSLLGFHDGKICQDGFFLNAHERFRKLLRSASSDIAVISSENLSFFFTKKAIEEFCMVAREIFDEIIVVAYIRRQDAQAVSHHQEGSKPWRHPESELYGTAPIALPPYEDQHRLYLDYARRLGLWAEVLGKQNLRIRVFEREKLKNGDIVEDFLEVIEVKVSGFVRVETLNEASGKIKVKLGHMMNEVYASRAPDLHDGKQLLRYQMPLQSPRMVPSRQAAREYYSAFRQSNITLNKRFSISDMPSIFSEDFTIYPLESNEAWTLKELEQALNASFDALAEAFSETSADHLLEACRIVEPTNSELAYRLIALARRLRPHHPAIVSRYHELRQLVNSN